MRSCTSFPADSDTSASLKKQAAETTTHLKSLNGAAFDKAYIDNEVGYHKAVIGVVSTVLIPNAQNAELKSALTGAAPLFQGHLEHAEHLQAGMTKSRRTVDSLCSDSMGDIADACSCECLADWRSDGGQ